LAETTIIAFGRLLIKLIGKLLQNA